MKTDPPSDGGEPGIEAPPASGLMNPISSLLIASHLITSASDEASLAEGFAKLMQSFDVDVYTLTALHRGPEPYLKVIAAWDRDGKAAVRPGVTFPVTADSLLTSLLPGAPLVVEEYHPGRPEHAIKMVRSFLESIEGRAYSLYPLGEGGELAGYLSIFYRTPHARSEEEVQFFSLLAQLTSVALMNLRSRSQLAKKVKQLKELYRVGEELSQLTDEDAVFKRAAQLLASEIHYVNCWIATVDEEAGVLRERGHAGLGIDPSQPPYVFPLHDRSAMAVASLYAGRPTVTRGLQERAQAEGWGDVAKAANLQTGIHVPLRAGGEPFGVLALGGPEVNVSPEEVSLLGAFANQLASVVVRLRMDGERARQMAELEAAYADQARLLETVRELSTPVIPVHDGVLVLPLVGMVDSSRSALLMESLLNAVQRERASVVILDITGVPTVDTGVANHVLRSTRAAALLGAQCVLVGVSPAVAQTMVQLGVDLGELVTRRNLQSGISYALGVLGRRIR